MRIFIFLIGVIALSFVSCTFYKSEILSFLKIHRDHNNDADLLVVLEGGSIRFPPTKERVSEALGLYINNNVKLLVCSKESLKNEILDYLVANGVKKKDLVVSNYSYDGAGGTFNNINEILSIIKSNEAYKNITIVTSPYHELRVDIMFSELIAGSGIDHKINLSFSHIENSEVEKTDIRRFVKIITHELIGILVFKYKLIVRKLFL